MRFVLSILVILLLTGCSQTDKISISESIKESISLADALKEINENIDKEYEVFTSLKNHYEFKTVIISEERQENLTEIDSFILAVNKGHSASIQIDLLHQNMTIKLNNLDKVITYEKITWTDGVPTSTVSVCDSFDKIETADLLTYVIISNGFIDQIIPVEKTPNPST